MSTYGILAASGPSATCVPLGGDHGRPPRPADLSSPSPSLTSRNGEHRLPPPSAAYASPADPARTTRTLAPGHAPHARAHVATNERRDAAGPETHFPALAPAAHAFAPPRVATRRPRPGAQKKRRRLRLLFGRLEIVALRRDDMYEARGADAEREGGAWRVDAADASSSGAAKRSLKRRERSSPRERSASFSSPGVSSPSSRANASLSPGAPAGSRKNASARASSSFARSRFGFEPRGIRAEDFFPPKMRRDERPRRAHRVGHRVGARRLVARRAAVEEPGTPRGAVRARREKRLHRER